MAKTLGMKPGFALDLTVNDDDGAPWDFSLKEKREKAAEKLEREKPFMLVTSPMCAKFCSLNALFNYPNMPKEKVTAELEEAMVHLKFTLEMYLKLH